MCIKKFLGLRIVDKLSLTTIICLKSVFKQIKMAIFAIEPNLIIDYRFVHFGNISTALLLIILE